MANMQTQMTTPEQKHLVALDRITLELIKGGAEIAEFPYPFLTREESLYSCLSAGRIDLLGRVGYSVATALQTLGPDWVTSLAARHKSKLLMFLAAELAAADERSITLDSSLLGLLNMRIYVPIDHEAYQVQGRLGARLRERGEVDDRLRDARQNGDSVSSDVALKKVIDSEIDALAAYLDAAVGASDRPLARSVRELLQIQDARHEVIDAIRSLRRSCSGDLQ